MDYLRVNRVSADAVLAEAHAMHARWPEMPTDEKRQIAKALIGKTAIGDGEIDINFT